MILLDASFGDPLGWDPELAEWIVAEVLRRCRCSPSR